MMERFKNVLVTGGAGYVGSVLVPKLLAKGYDVKVIDLYLYGDDVLDSVKGHPQLKQVKGDIRDQEMLEKEIPGTDALIHLACISNDPVRTQSQIGKIDQLRRLYSSGEDIQAEQSKTIYFCFQLECLWG